MRKPRKNYTPVENVTTLRRHLINRVPVSTSATSISCRRRCSTSGRSSSWRVGTRPSSAETAHLTTTASRGKTPPRTDPTAHASAGTRSELRGIQSFSDGVHDPIGIMDEG